jgi:DNA-directed RNA polymerase specialized sigma24 family protein
MQLEGKKRRDFQSGQNKLFKRFKGGDSAALIDFLENERPKIYDYLMRMTGQISRSFESVSEVFQSIADGEAKGDVDGAEELRCMLYVTARKFNADIWNAETSRLINPAIETGEEGSAARETVAFQALDKSLRNLKGVEREIVLLRSRCDFEFEGIAEIMTMDEADVENQFYRGMQRIDADCSGVVEQPEKMLTRMPSHPPPEHSNQATMNLSVMMHDIKTRPVRLWSPLRVFLMLIIIASATVYFVFPGKVRELLHVSPWHAPDPAFDGTVEEEVPTSDPAFNQAP